MPHFLVLVALAVFVPLSIFSINKQHGCTCQVFVFIHIHKRYFLYVLAAGGPSNTYHVPCILLPVHQKLVYLYHCPRLPVLALYVGVIYLL